METGREGNQSPIVEGLGGIKIELTGRDALAVAASLDLGGLALKHTRRKALSLRDSDIMNNALRKINR